MVHIVKKRKDDKTYLYLRQNHRVDGKSKQKWVIYLGPEHDDEKIKNKLSTAKTPDSFEIFDFVFPAVLLGIAKRLDLVDIINKYTTKRNQGISVGEYMLIAVLNRGIKPTSKNQLQSWFDQTYLKNEYPLLQNAINSNAYSNHFKYLTEDAIEKIEDEIRQKLITEYNVDMSSLFYDPTNFYTFINPGDTQNLPRHGHSKEGRNVLNIVNLSLFCSEDSGIPVMHRTYPGNIVDVNHFKTEFPRFLKKFNNHEEIVLIFDKGNISDELFKELSKSEVKFIASIRPSTQTHLHHLSGDDFEIFELPNKKKIGAKEFATSKENELYRIIVSYEPSRNKWYGSNLSAKLDKKIAEIDDWFKNRLNKKMWSRKDSVDKKMEKLIGEKFKKYIEYSITGEDGELILTYNSVQDKVDEHISTLGKSYLMTNIENIRPIDIIWRYRQQYIVERAFKYIKHNDFLSIRPMFHYNDDSIRGHVFSCVLGLTLLSLLHREVNVKFPEISMPKMISELKSANIIRMTTGNRVIEKIIPASEELTELLKFLNFEKYLP